MKIGIDTGGTFTDLVATNQKSIFHIKVPSTPKNPEQAIFEALTILQKKSGETIEQADVRHGTTVATNALLEQTGANLVLITNRHLEDIFFLRRQARDELYALHPQNPSHILERENILGIGGRINPQGEIIISLEDLNAWNTRNGPVLSRAEAISVCLLHSYVNSTHEKEIKSFLEKIYPQKFITISSELAPLEREYERTTTVVANGYVAPMMEKYMDNLCTELKKSSLSIMGSAGGLLPVSRIRKEPVHSLLSGPAGGVRGAWLAGLRCQRKQLLSLDMGGTSTDIALIEGELTPKDEAYLENIPLRIPFLPIETIGSGGGSIAYIDSGGTLRVGPKSTGAKPGPAAYGQQGKELIPTITDANVVLGRLTCLLGGEMQLDPKAARKALQKLAVQLSSDVQTTAEAILAIAEAKMARACKRISLDHGVDPRHLTLVAFGGAGGLHACRLAEELGIREIIFPRESGLLSAEGVLSAPQESYLCKNLELSDKEWRKNHLFGELIKHHKKLEEKFNMDFPKENLSTRQTELYLDCRYAGQTFTLPIPLRKLCTGKEQDIAKILSRSSETLIYGQISSLFQKTHQARYGYILESTPIVASTLRGIHRKVVREKDKKNNEQQHVLENLIGPQTIRAYSSTFYLNENWQAKRLSTGDLFCTFSKNPTPQMTFKKKSLSLEIHKQRLVSIAEEMGATLMRASFSANIKERRDYSCALFDGKGNLLVQAAHIPVHLGSQPLSVKAAIGKVEMRPGINIILNDPFSGGTHLPDITLISPVYHPSNHGHQPDFFVANRAHHADVGGLDPGSMPAPISADGKSRRLTIDDEGWRIGPTILNEEIRCDLANTSRTPHERYGDLRAQEAANMHGGKCLIKLMREQHDLSTHNNNLIEYAEDRMQALLKEIPDGDYLFEDYLDDDGISTSSIKLNVKILIRGKKATIDFRDNPDALDSSLNAVRAIVVSAVSYVFCCIGGEELPANAGLMRPIEILTRPGSILDAQPPSAVSAGNVETSQRLVDLLYGALAQALPNKIPAASCGSMNNVLFGGIDTRHQQEKPFVHYETLGGGAGAGPNAQGADAIHTHMTNTLNTPIEALERHFPVLIEEYALRRHSKVSTSNAYRGGRGIVRQYRFLVPTQVTIMSDRRTHTPYGLHGAPAGEQGNNYLIKEGSQKILLPGKTSLQLEPNEVIRIETPSGGCWRSPGK